MSRRFFVLLLLLAALFTAATYLYKAETKETLSDPELTDSLRVATVHGWPWGYYAQVTELTRVSEQAVAVIEYNDLRWQMLGQTYLAWFVFALILISVLVVAASPGQKRG